MNAPSPTVVLVEDEEAIRRFARMALEGDGCAVHEAATLKRALIEASTRRPDLVILDLGLPDGDGLDFIAEFRSWSEIPIIVLSARTAEAEKVAALDAGADDFLTKPFGTAELLARVRAHLRRRLSVPAAAANRLELDGLVVDLAQRVIERDGLQLHLTPIEFRLLSYLLANPNCVLTHRQILKAVWGPSHAEDHHYVRIYMGHLRKKLESAPSKPRHLLTESGVGYRFISERL